MNSISDKDRAAFLAFQQTEVTESRVYEKLAHIEKNKHNKEILMRLSREETGHAEILKKYTGKDLSPNRWRVFKFSWLARIFGLTFAIKLMEMHEQSAQNAYLDYPNYPDLKQIAEDEEVHESQLVSMINEERLEYMGSIVLGLNDALVEFTGALAGFTLALNDSSLIALTGSITGIAAALSMASSEYLSSKSEKNETKNPVRAAIYTGFAYIVTVTVLVLPFILISNVLISLGTMLAMALFIIAIFNFYYSVARNENFKKRFAEMAILSFSVASISFLIGYALKYFTGIEA